MKKEKFSFVKWLTNKDVEKILNLVGFEVLTDEKNPDKKRINKYKDEDGYKIYVYCKNVKQMKEDLEITKALASTEIGKKFVPLIVGGMFGEYGINGPTLLAFEDFTLYELLSLRLDEEETVKFNRYLTKVYQNYMKQKFGRYYIDMKRAYCKKLYKEIREENKENNEESKDL